MAHEMGFVTGNIFNAHNRLPIDDVNHLINHQKWITVRNQLFDAVYIIAFQVGIDDKWFTCFSHCFLV